MRFVTVRELRNTPSKVWEALESSDLVLTSNGRPAAVLVRVGEGEDLEETLGLLRRVRAQAAVSRLRAAAAASGADRLGADQIEAEIRAARRGRR